LHLMVEAPGFQKLVTALYPEGDEWLASDAVFGVKKSLVVVSDMMIRSFDLDI
jgi:protocatechuate 3,4-dioxygenase beta subunit